MVSAFAPADCQPVLLPASFVPAYTGKAQTPATLATIAAKLRITALEMIYTAQSGHPGSSFSCMDMLVALWFSQMRHCATQPNWAHRDRFVLSKGHAAPALYAVLMEAGYIPWGEKSTLRQVHSKLQGHPASKYVAGVDVSTGSLGQGLSCAVGMALGLRLDKNPARVYALMGDGECQEGNIWEAFMSGAHHKVNRLTAFVDRNRLQIDGNTESVKAVGDMVAKAKAFDWQVLEVDGHDFTALQQVLAEADRLADTTEKPTCVVATTIKGKGVSFMENQAGWHGKAPNKEQFEAAMLELNATYQALKDAV
jgi:transketolase